MQKPLEGTSIDHWTYWIPETPAEVDWGAENLNGQMMAGSLVRDFTIKMGHLYTYRCDMVMFPKQAGYYLNFENIMVA